jgi:hypothetical protein
MMLLKYFLLENIKICIFNEDQYDVTVESIILYNLKTQHSNEKIFHFLLEQIKMCIFNEDRYDVTVESIILKDTQMKRYFTIQLFSIWPLKTFSFI